MKKQSEILFESRVLQTMAHLRKCLWDKGVVVDVRRYPEFVQPHGGVVCREAATRLIEERARLVNQARYAEVKCVYQTEQRRAAKERSREQLLERMRERHGWGSGMRRVNRVA